jgi:hypothetical protein
MGKIKKIAKDPIFIGAGAGLLFGILTAIFYAGFEGRLMTAKVLFLATYPVPAGLAALHALRRLWHVWDEALIVVTGFLWYLQYGFFMGLFFKLMRKRYSWRASALAIATTIILLCSIIFCTNLRYWRHF